MNKFDLIIKASIKAKKIQKDINNLNIKNDCKVTILALDIILKENSIND